MVLSTEYKLFGKEISGPFTIPSGIVATEISTVERIANEIPEIGILTTKSTGLEPRKGNREPILAQYAPFSFINAVGLTNPGSEETARRISNTTIPDNRVLIGSLIGSNEEEFGSVAKILLNHVDGFELNISCPHGGKYGQVIAQDKELVERVTRSVVSLGKEVFVKISPNVDVRETVRYAIKGGASGITGINTRGPEFYPILSNRVGGVSGKEILELGLRCVREVRSVTDLPIIACGGISTAEDVRKYEMAGADFFGVGSALAGMDTKTIKEYFHELFEDLKKGTNNAEKLLVDRLNMQYVKFKVEENRRLADDLLLLKLNDSIKVDAGQFIFAWLPEKGEKPFSVFDDEPLTLLIQRRGCFTDELSKLEKGQTVYVRGPYGKSPEIGEKTLLVGGGTGIAALHLFAKRNEGSSVVIGAKDKSHLPYWKSFESLCERLYLNTENGETGHTGLVTDLLDRIIETVKPEYCINCGPEPMVRNAIQKETRYVNPEKVYSSIEFLTKCGIGLCGSCATSKGYRSCVDGTFLKVDQI